MTRRTITTLDDLRDVVPNSTSDLILTKDMTHLGDVARAFIALSPYLLLSTRGTDGLQDITPRGDPPGFVQVVDDTTLLIPDRPGNNRLDSFQNLLGDPSIGLIFIVPGHADTLRVAGVAEILQDETLAQTLAINGRAPALILSVTVREVFMHCSKAAVRSGIWQPETWPARRSAPSLADWTATAAKTDQTSEEIQAIHDEAIAKRLY